MRGYVVEHLLEARRRTALHARVKARGVVDRDFLVPEAPPYDPESEIAAEQPTGAAIVWLALALSVGVSALLLVLVLR